ncbi:MAG TPA: SPOR domain-containing protein [Methylomirabilota bacterium]|nr:SPOR domain-containing protein [Methylomirabilota bacterium]
MRYRHVWPGFLLLAALALLLVGLLRWGDHFLSPGPTGGINRLLQLWAASRPAEESIAPPAAAAPSPAMDAPANPPVVAAPPVIVPVTPEASGPAAQPAPAPSGSTPVASTPVPPVPAPVVKAPAPERAEEPREAAAGPTTPPPVRYALALGTFPLSEDAERVEAKLNQAGFSTVRFRLQTPAKLFAVQVSSLKDPEEGQATVERLQKEGHPPSVLLVGRTGVTVRVGPPTPLRTAVQLAEKLRATGYDARVATEPTRAGQVSLRHGNFASRAEADAASREVARLGVPNEVIQVR